MCPVNHARVKIAQKETGRQVPHILWDLTPGDWLAWASVLGPTGTAAPGGCGIGYSSPKAASNATVEGSKSTLRTNSQASAAPCSRSMPLSSHSTESGPS